MQNQTAQHTLTLSWVTSATGKFVFAEEMRKAFSLALVAGVNMIFSGPGGHAKSEFLEAAMSAIHDTRPYVKSFGQGTSTEELYGGIDLDAMNGHGGGKATLQFNPELSFLSYPIAVFEELFDAPARVLTSLKDTLTAHELRNGHQHYPMATKMIAAATNHSPQDIAEGGPEIAALVERFPVQLEVKWDNYGEAALMAMFDATLTSNKPERVTVSWNDVAAMQQRVQETTISKSMQRLLARIIVELRQDNVTVSPRTAMLAVQLVRAAAVINGRDKVVGNDVTAIAFLPGVHRLKDRVEELVAEYSRTIGIEEAMDTIAEQINDLVQHTGDIGNLDAGMLKALDASWTEIETELNELPYESGQQARRNQLINSVAHHARHVRNAVAMIAEKARDEERVYGRNVTRLKEILRDAKSSGNKMWNASDKEQDDIELELLSMQEEVNAMELRSHQLDLRDKALSSIEVAIAKRY